MMKNNYFAIIDFGLAGIRIGIFSEKLNNLYLSSKNINEVNDYTEHSKSIKFLVREAEKKISDHLEKVTVLYDSPEFFSIDLSIKRIFDQKTSFNNVYSNIILETSQLIKDNYINNKIIHVIVTKYIVDEKEVGEIIDDHLVVKSIIIEIKFICLPFENFNKIQNVFKNSNLQISNIFCSSFVKSFSYINSLNKNNFISFLDIGWERSSVNVYKNKKLNFVNSIPIGANHITKDISNILKIGIKESELIKRALNNNEIEFSYDLKDNKDKNAFIKEITDKKISIDILKKVVLARIEEIIELVFEDVNSHDELNNFQNSILVLTGNGSKLFNNNSFHLENKFNFREISFYDETEFDICKAGLNFENKTREESLKIVKKNQKKLGIFEKFFNYFSS